MKSRRGSTGGADPIPPEGLDKAGLRFYSGGSIRCLLHHFVRKEEGRQMTTLVRWDPFREAAAVHNELSRLMNGLFEGNGRATQSWVPMLATGEPEAALVSAFPLPGVAQEKISVEAEEGALTVTAERER